MKNLNFSEIFQALNKLFRKELEISSKSSRDPFRILISCILSLRTKDEVSIPASERLFKLIKTPENLLKLPNKKIEQLIYPVGFYRRKAENIKQISQKLITEFGSKVPSTKTELLLIKGVGLKTANLVLSRAFNIPAICVDTHVHRISNRLGWVKTKSPDETEGKLSEILPKKYWHDINELLILHGRNTCKPRGPKCRECVINKYCVYFEGL
jgi:endonuclease III